MNLTPLLQETLRGCLNRNSASIGAAGYGQGSLSSATPGNNSNRSGRSSQETNDCVFDDAVEVVLNGHAVDPSPDGEIKQFAMQPPGNFEFFRGRRRIPDVA